MNVFAEAGFGISTMAAPSSLTQERWKVFVQLLRSHITSSPQVKHSLSCSIDSGFDLHLLGFLLFYPDFAFDFYLLSLFPEVD